MKVQNLSGPPSPRPHLSRLASVFVFTGSVSSNSAKALTMEELRDAIYYMQLARAARLKAAATDDVELSLRLREAAIRHERKARQLKSAGV